jgi:hypothetical protein
MPLLVQQETTTLPSGRKRRMRLLMRRVKGLQKLVRRRRHSMHSRFLEELN